MSPLGTITGAFGDSLSSNTPTTAQDIIALDSQALSALLVQWPQAQAALDSYKTQLKNAQSPMLSNRAMFSIGYLQAQIAGAEATIANLDTQIKAAIDKVLTDATALKAAF